MSELAHDEKICPFCAETIKSAAIKCRYCGSDVASGSDTATPSPMPDSAEAGVTSPGLLGRSAREPAGSTARTSPADSPGSDAPVDATVDPTAGGDAEVEGAAGSESVGDTSRPRAVWPLLGVLLLAGVLAVVFAVMRVNADETAPDGTRTSNSARAVAMQRAADSTATILSYSAGTFDADAEKAGQLMTDEMRADYLKALEPVKAKVVKEGIELKATVVATSLTHFKEDSVRALLFVNQSTTAKGASNEQLDNNRVVVTMKREKGDWLVSKMDPF